MTQHEPYDDDLPVGRLLNRREALLALAGAGAAVALAACAPGSSTVHRAGHGDYWRFDRHDERQYARLRGAPGADRGAVLRRREAEPLRHPLRSLGRLGQAGRAAAR